MVGEIYFIPKCHGRYYFRLNKAFYSYPWEIDRVRVYSYMWRMLLYNHSSRPTIATSKPFITIYVKIY